MLQENRDVKNECEKKKKKNECGSLEAKGSECLIDFSSPCAHQGIGGEVRQAWTRVMAYRWKRISDKEGSKE